MSSLRGQGHRASMGMRRNITWNGHFPVAVAMEAVIVLPQEGWRHLDRHRMRVMDALVHVETVVVEVPAWTRQRGTSMLWAMVVAEVQATSISEPGIEPTRTPARQM